VSNRPGSSFAMSPRSEIAVAVKLGVRHEIFVAQSVRSRCGLLAFLERGAFGGFPALHRLTGYGGWAQYRQRISVGRQLWFRRCIARWWRIQHECGGHAISCHPRIRQPSWLKGSINKRGDTNENGRHNRTIKIGYYDRNATVSTQSKGHGSVSRRAGQPPGAGAAGASLQKDIDSLS
jgi:hypothetical protein